MKPYKTMMAGIGIVCALLAAGCAAELTSIKAYNGPELPPDQVAKLESSVGVIVYAVDGDKSFHCARCQLMLTPGSHQLEVGFASSANVSDLAVRMAKNRTIDLTLKKAHAYNITAWEDVKNRTYFVVVFDDTDKAMIYSDLQK